DPVLPRLAGLQRDGAVSTEKVAIVERAMHQLSKPHLDPQTVETAEQLLTDHAAILAPPELRRFAHAVINAADPDGPEPIDDQLQHDRRYLELKQRRDGMWHVAGRLTNTLGTQLNAILDPLTNPARLPSKTRTARSSTSPTSGPRCNDSTTPSRKPAANCSKQPT